MKNNSYALMLSKVEKYLTVEGFIHNKGQVVMLDGIVSYNSQKLTIVDIKNKTISPYHLSGDTLPAVKKVKTFVLNQAVIRGFKILPEIGDRYFKDLSPIVQCKVAHDYWLSNQSHTIEDIYNFLVSDESKQYNSEGEET